MHTTQWFHATRIPNISSANLVQIGIGGWAGRKAGMAVARERGTTVLTIGDAPGTGTPEPGGLSSREMLRFISIVAREAPLCGMEVVEVAADPRGVLRPGSCVWFPEGSSWSTAPPTTAT
jgi:arginase family enzyme